MLSEEEKQAFASLYERSHKKLYATALYLCRDKSAAEDVLQETALAAFRGFQKLREPGVFHTWITKILLHEAMRYKRAGQKHSHSELTEETAAVPGQASFQNEEFFCLLEGLREEHRRAVVLKYLSGLSVAEIAEICRVPQGTVKSRLSRALRQMRNEYEGENHEAGI